MTLAEELKDEILQDEYFLDLFQKAERISAHDLFQVSLDEKLSDKEYLDLMRFADILSHSNDSNARNKAYKIITLLVKDFGNLDSFKIFAGAILSKLGNFPALTFLKDNYSYIENLPLERNVEKRIKSEVQKTSKGDRVFTDTQYKIKRGLESFDYFSFSGPTSIGKSFILKDFIRYLINQKNSAIGGAVVVLVPTRALISQTTKELRDEIDDREVNITAFPILSAYSLNKYRHHIFVFTPERLLSYTSGNYLKIKYLFVDEAQKIIAENDARSSLYYHAIYETSRRFATKIVFASPSIPNPDIFLKIFEKDSAGSYSTNEQTVSQNRYFVDLKEKRISFFSELGGEYSINDSQLEHSSVEIIKNLGKNCNNIIYCNGISETVTRAKDFSKNMEDVEDDDIKKLITLVSEYVHKDYYLIECLRKGVAFHHGRMPQKIRREIEDLFNNKNSLLRYVFCTSTLLEGVNLPARNIFILNDNHGSSVFKKIDFENLTGRAGRLTREFSGNVICIRDDPRHWKNCSDLLKREPLEQVESFIINKNKQQKKEFSNIGKALMSQKLASGLRTGERENIEHYASIVLSHYIENNGSTLKSGFLEKNKEALEILQKASKKNNVPSTILKLSSTIKPLYQNRVLDYINDHGKYAILNIDLEDKASILQTLETLYDLYNWGEEELGRDCLIPTGLVRAGYGKSRLKYWAMLLRNWVKSEPLSQLIIFSIKFHFDIGEIWFYENGVPKKEDFIGNRKQINIVIEQIMGDLENGLRFRIEKYFCNYYLLLKYVLGEKEAGQDWSEFIEYGTTDKKIIELQNTGLSRGASKYLLAQYANLFTFNDLGQLLKIKEELLRDIDKTGEYYEEVKEVLG